MFMKCLHEPTMVKIRDFSPYPWLTIKHIPLSGTFFLTLVHKTQEGGRHVNQWYSINQSYRLREISVILTHSLHIQFLTPHLMAINTEFSKVFMRSVSIILQKFY